MKYLAVIFSFFLISSIHSQTDWNFYDDRNPRDPRIYDVMFQEPSPEIRDHICNIIRYKYDLSGNRTYRYFDECGSKIFIHDDLYYDFITLGDLIEEQNLFIDSLKPFNDNIPKSQRKQNQFDYSIIYPNPTQGKCTLECSNNIIEGTLIILDAKGQILERRVVSGRNFDIDLSGRSSGEYMVLLSADGISVRKSVILE